MKALFFPVALVLFLSVPLAAAYAEKLPTEKGTLDVNLEVELGDNSGQPKLKIDFLNPITEKIQVHIDYKVTILDKSKDNVSRSIPLTHTSAGSVKIPVDISPEGQYDVLVEVEGILFQPIEPETVTFAIGGAENKADPKSEEGGCLIATAAYGSELAPQVQHLRQIRDTVLQNSDAGSAFLGLFHTVYYAFSPTVADFERESDLFREMVRIYLAPMIATLHIMEHADSEAKVVAYGTGLILLNAAVYIIAPVTAAVLSWKILKTQSLNPLRGKISA